MGDIFINSLSQKKKFTQAGWSLIPTVMAVSMGTIHRHQQWERSEMDKTSIQEIGKMTL